MDDSSSNISTSSSTLEEMSNKSSEALGDTSAMGLVQQTSHNDSVTTSTSFSDMNVDSVTSDISFHDISGGASSGTGNQSMDSSLEGDQSGDIGVFHTKRKIHGKDKKVCRVCGDKALGYNFNAMTCESCKAFFRRNALKQQTPNCMFQGNCVVDVRTRRFCPHCRLKKCFSMGMKKEMILDGIQSQKRKATRQVPRGKHLEETVKLSIAGCNRVNDPAVERQSNSVISLDIDDEATNMDSQKKEEKDGIIPRNHRILSEEESVKLECLTGSFMQFVNSEIEITLDLDLTCIQGLLNFSAFMVNDFVRFIKTNDDFRSLTVDTQSACLKAHLLSCFVLHSIYTFNPRTCTFDALGRSIHEVFVIESFTPHCDVALNFIKLCRESQKEFTNDPNIHAILQMILVLSPDGVDMLTRRHLSNIQDKYLILLKHYLESNLSFSCRREMYAYLLQKLQEVKGCSIRMLAVLHQINTAMVEPLMLEVFNFKQ